ncbi:MAG: CvpA family protein [Sphingobacteriia bacterium]|nr:CvpA family protein [Sphingobacteriia bacterium]
MKLALFNSFDYFIIILVTLSVLLGIVKGFLQTFLSLLRLTLSIVTATYFSYLALPIVQRHVTNKDIAEYAAFISTFLATFIILSIIKFYIIRLLNFINKGAVDRTFGGWFGLVRGVVLSSFLYISIISFTEALQIKNHAWPYQFSINNERLPKWILGSQLNSHLFETSKNIIAVLPENWWKKIEGFLITNQAPVKETHNDFQNKLLESISQIGEQDKIKSLMDRINSASPAEKEMLMDELREFFSNEDVNKKLSYTKYKEILRLLDNIEHPKSD